ncbi:hypothetical protein K1719_014647 [Acacia pycnantha]|nr:hypothetical protein K1719_014647 [Acacia pycnantha]
MADKDGTKPLSSNPSPLRILQDLFAPNKLSTNSSDDDHNKLPSRREDVEASSNDSKSEEHGVPDKSEAFDPEGFDYAGADYSTLLQQDPCDSSSGATEIVGGGIEESVENDSEYSVQLDYFASESDNTITFDCPNCTFKLQGEIAATLLEHQRDGLKWLWSLHCQGKGGILADDMGLGKTRQICTFLAGLFNPLSIKRVLVVAPKTLLPHWIKELSAVGLSEKTRV